VTLRPVRPEDFDVAASSISKPTFDCLASLDGFRAAENLCLIGPAGTRKSQMLVALGIAAAVHGTESDTSPPPSSSRPSPLSNEGVAPVSDVRRGGSPYWTS
jgi:hypothetical protein